MATRNAPEMDPAQRAYLQGAFEWFLETGDWPPLRIIHRQLVKGSVSSRSADEVARKFGPGITTTSMNLNDPAFLTVRGISLCPRSDSLLNKFLKALELCVKTYMESPVAESASTVSSTQIQDSLGITDLEIKQIGKLLQTEGNILGSGHNDPDGSSWEYELSDQIYDFLSVSSISDYLEVKNRHIRYLRGMAGDVPELDEDELNVVTSVVMAEQEGLDIHVAALAAAAGSRTPILVLFDRLERAGYLDVAILRNGSGTIMSAHVRRPTTKGLEVSRRGSISVDASEIQAEESGGKTRSSLTFEEQWIPPRLWVYIEPSVVNARRTDDPTEWGKVTREAALFLENEIRMRTGIDTPGRQELAAKALAPTTGALKLKKHNDLQKAWMQFVQGIFGAFSNPGAHTIRQHSAAFAMGVVGAVSVVLVMLDEEIGPPSVPKTPKALTANSPH